MITQLVPQDDEEEFVGFGRSPWLESGVKTGVGTLVSLAGLAAGPLGIIANMLLGQIFRQPVICQDPITGEVLTGALCSGAAWRGKCADPKTWNEKDCGKELYWPGKIICPPRSKASDMSPTGVPTGRCVCELGIMSKAEALKVGCDLALPWKYAPLFLLAGAAYLVTK